MSIGKKKVVVMMCMAVGAMISSCGDKGISNEAVTRGAKVNPVVNSGRSAISTPVVKGREIEVNPLVAKIDKEMERVGAYRAASDAIMEGKVNRALNEGQDKIGMQEIDVREIEEALKEVEKMEEGRRKEVLKLFFQKAKSHCKGQRESLSAWGDRKGGSCQGQAYISHEIWNKELHKIEAERMDRIRRRRSAGNRWRRPYL